MVNVAELINVNAQEVLTLESGGYNKQVAGRRK
jgi:hypothetical protein